MISVSLMICGANLHISWLFVLGYVYDWPVIFIYFNILKVAFH